MQNFIMRPCRDLLQRIALVLLICLIAGCSAVRFGYANGESVLYWWFDGYLNFNQGQKPWVKREIGKLLAWHRHTQLPDYAAMLAWVEQRIQRNQQVSAADVLNEYAAVKKRAQIVIEHALPQLTELALSLQSDQIAHLEKKFASNNESYRKDYLRGDLEQRQQFRFKQVMKQAEYWFGGFSTEQEAKLRAASYARPLNNELWMEERRRRQQEMIRMLRKIQSEKPSREAAMALVRNYAAKSFEVFAYDDDKTFFDVSRDGMAQMVAVIVNIATPAQRAHAIRRLRKWEEDCWSLAAQNK